MKTSDLLFVFLFFAILFSSCSKEEKVTRKNAISFEEIILNENGYYNGSDNSGGFTSGNAHFKTFYNFDYSSWSGFAVSNHTDTLNADFTNQYSSMAGSGAGHSSNYAVLYSTYTPGYISSDTIVFEIPAVITNIALSNSAYAYHTMKNGNMFSKKFGGDSGNDPDYFHLYISAVDEKGTKITFDPIPLADFTFSDNSLDYISKTWEYYNLSKAGNVKYLIFSFDSSDKTGAYLNTPMYVCIDNLVNEYKED